MIKLNVPYKLMVHLGLTLDDRFVSPGDTIVGYDKNILTILHEQTKKGIIKEMPTDVETYYEGRKEQDRGLDGDYEFETKPGYWSVERTGEQEGELTKETIVTLIAAETEEEAWIFYKRYLEHTWKGPIYYKENGRAFRSDYDQWDVAIYPMKVIHFKKRAN